MGNALRHHFFTRAQYVQMENDSNVRHEYYRGEIYAMAGGSPTRARIIGQITTALNNLLRDTSCIAAPADQRVLVEAAEMNTYPDVAVYCDEARFDELDRNALLEPLVLVEVLSPSTAQYDRNAKRDFYFQIPSLRDYLIVWQDQIRVQHYFRGATGAWEFTHYLNREARAVLVSFSIELPLSEIYRRLDLPDGVVETE